jgi:hypothetical protein
MATYINPDNGSLIIKSVKDLDLSDIQQDDAAFAVLGGQWIGGNLYVGGTFVANGDIVTLGNSGGVLTFNTNISSDVLPATTKTYNLGSNTEFWKSAYVESIILDTSDAATTVANAETALSKITSSTSTTVTLAAGTEGQQKTLTVVDTLASAVFLTPSSARGFTSISFTNAGDSVTLVFINGSWNIVSVFRASVIA